MLARLRTFALVLVALTSAGSSWAGRYQIARRGTAFGKLLGNLTKHGSVMAAPSGNHEYQFHWTRDAAISMAEVLVRMKELPRGAERNRLSDQYKKYVRFSGRMLKDKGEAGAGEPKAFPDGKAYRPWWGRPQNDGPALRVLGNMAFAEWSERHEGHDFTESALYNKSVGHAQQQLIKSDLKYIYNNRNKPSYDVWEEQLGFHFYTRAVQAQAFARGARFLGKMGDERRAEMYRNAAKELTGYLDTHWDAENKLIRATVDAREGVKHKWTGLDSAVILAVNHVQGPDSPLHVLDERILSTAHLLEVDFKRDYDINKGLKSGLFIGRYPEDRYTGHAGVQHDKGGNPWVITTHGFAEYYFRVAAALRKADGFQITDVNRRFLLSALGLPESTTHLKVGTTLKGDDPHLAELVTAIVKKGDGFLAAVRSVVGDGVQTEQIHRTTGEKQGAEELTWNYASYLSAMRARDRAGAPTEEAR